MFVPQMGNLYHTVFYLGQPELSGRYCYRLKISKWNEREHGTQGNRHSCRPLKEDWSVVADDILAGNCFPYDIVQDFFKPNGMEFTIDIYPQGLVSSSWVESDW